VDRGDHRNDASDLLFGGNGLVAGPRGLSAEVKNIGALVDHAAGLGDCGLDGGVAVAGGRGQQAIARERIGRDVHDPHDVRAAAPLERARPDAVGEAARARPAGSSRRSLARGLQCGERRIGHETRVVHEYGRAAPTDRGSRRRWRGRFQATPRAASRAARGSAKTSGCAALPAEPPRPPSARQAARAAGPGRPPGGAYDPRLPQQRRPGECARTPSTSLSAMMARTSVGRPGARNGARSSSAWARVAAPAGLWAPSSSTSRPRSRSAPGAPASERPRIRPAGRRRRHGQSRGFERIQRGVGDRRVRRLVATSQGDADRSQPTELDVDSVAVQAEQRRRRRHGQRRRHAPAAALDHVER